MSPINIAIVGLRLLAIYCFLQSIPLLTTFGFMRLLSDHDAYGMSSVTAYLFAFGPGGSLLLLSVLLFTYSIPIARRLVPADATEAEGVVCTFDQFQATAFAVAGILILVSALPTLFHSVEGLISLFSHQRDGGTLRPHQLRDSSLYCIGEVAQFVIGLLLLLNPRGFRNLWYGLRTSGT